MSTDHCVIKVVMAVLTVGLSPCLLSLSSLSVISLKKPTESSVCVRSSNAMLTLSVPRLIWLFGQTTITLMPGLAPASCPDLADLLGLERLRLWLHERERRRLLESTVTAAWCSCSVWRTSMASMRALTCCMISRSVGSGSILEGMVTRVIQISYLHEVQSDDSVEIEDCLSVALRRRVQRHRNTLFYRCETSPGVCPVILEVRKCTGQVVRACA
jgi:hypothetical protein